MTVRKFPIFARGRFAVRVDGVVHEVVDIKAVYASVVFACVEGCAVLVDPDTEVRSYNEVDVDCMACLAGMVSS